MQDFKRFAIYYAPERGPFAAAAAAWLGWDPVRGQPEPQPDLGPDLGVDLAPLTEDPRKYGFHGTIKPPFRLAAGVSLADVQDQTTALARRLTPIVMPGLHLISLHGFLALVPQGDTAALGHLAAQVVETLDGLRAPLTDAEIARRRPDRLTPRQRDLLDRYGYPHVMEEFQFHLTLSGRLTSSQTAALHPLALAHFAPVQPKPFTVAELCLFAEAADGRFHLLTRHPLG